MTIDPRQAGQISQLIGRVQTLYDQLSVYRKEASDRSQSLNEYIRMISVIAEPVQIQVLTETLQLEDDDPVIIAVDPGGASRAVITPPPGPANHLHILINLADAAEELNVENELGVSVVDICEGKIGILVSDGDAELGGGWVAIDAEALMQSVWKGIDLTPYTTGHPTTNPPGTTEYQNVPFDAFSAATEEQVFYIWHVPHDFAVGVANTRGHFGGMVAVDPAGQTEYIAMGFEYTKISPGEIFDISTPDGGGSINIVLEDAEGNYLWHQTDNGLVDTTGWDHDDIVIFRFFRDVDGTYTGEVGEAEDDDYAGDALIGAYHLEYLSDKLGIPS